MPLSENSHALSAQQKTDAFAELVNTIEQLCSPTDGCPWNNSQTHTSIGDYLIEEAYEALDAIQQNDIAHLREELGDVLLQVLLHSQIAANNNEFDIAEVCEDLNHKMIRRHPHVFGDAKATNASEVAVLWEQVKLQEKLELEVAQNRENEQAQAQGQGQGRAESEHSLAPLRSLLDDVPTHFPALLQAQKISRKAAAVGFEWETIDDIWDKVSEEKLELLEAYADAPKAKDGSIIFNKDESEKAEAAQMEFGDLLFALVNLARRMGIDAEAALRASNAKFCKRFSSIEQAAYAQGQHVEALSLEEMEALWQCAKEDE